MAAPVSSGTRARNQITITGPIPRMLDEAMAWARRTFGTSIVSSIDGEVHDQPDYPYLAFREIIANAILHRDLDSWSVGIAVEVRLRADCLIVSNPGGLYGITVERLGHDAVTSVRNARLVAICQNTRSPATGARVVEALATGIPVVTDALVAAGLPPARYTGIGFTVILRRTAEQTDGKLSRTQLRVYDALHGAGSDVAELEAELGLSAPNIRKALRALRSRGLVEQLGGRGTPTRYRRLTTLGS